MTMTLCPEILNNEILCDEYTIYKNDYKIKNGGGVLIAIKSIFRSEEIQIHNRNNLEFTSVAIKLNDKTLYITCSYIPPNSRLY